MKNHILTMMLSAVLVLGIVGCDDGWEFDPNNVEYIDESSGSDDGSSGSDDGSSGSNPGSGSSSEECAASNYPGYLSDEPQLVGHCQLAWLYKCQLPYYPTEKEELESRITIVCQTLDDAEEYTTDGSNPKYDCPPCSGF